MAVSTPGFFPLNGRPSDRLLGDIETPFSGYFRTRFRVAPAAFPPHRVSDSLL